MKLIHVISSRVQYKIAAVIFAAVLVSSLVNVWHGGDATIDALEKGAYTELTNAALSEGAKIEAYLNGVVADLNFLSEMPPTPGVFRALDNWNIDPVDGSTTSLWIERGETMMKGLVQAKPIYMRLRLINNDGRELMRVDRNKGQIEIPAAGKRPNRKNADYFTNTIKLTKGQVYVSSLTLNREFGKIETPHRPVIRYAIPVYSEGKQQGALVVDVEAQIFLNSLQAGQTEGSFRTFLVDQKGTYLSHFESEKMWGDVLEHQASLSKDFPNITKKILSNQTGFVTANEHVFAYAPVHPLAENQDNYWVIVQCLSEDLVFADVSSFRMISFFILLFSLAGTVIIGSSIARRIISTPLKDLTDVAKAVAEGDLEHQTYVKSEDEIGMLGQSVNDMVYNLKKGREEIQVTIDMANSVVEEVKHTADQLKAGFIHKRANVGDATGNFRNMVEGFNDAVNSIVKPLLETIEIINKYANGDLSAKLHSLPGELKVLPDALDGIRENLQSLIDEAAMLAKAGEDGRLSARGDVSRFEGGYKTIIEGMNNTLENITKPVNEGVSVLTEMAKGNLAVSLSGDYHGDHALMKNSMNSTINALNKTLAEVSEAVNQVTAGAHQVSQSSGMLSQNATESASSLEEISASMNEIGVQVQQNAENAQQVNKLVRTARGVADEGNKEMQGMLAAMKNINESSVEISKIIKTIDEIAFQTNLLALNAAVEAARAGVHGKGFAVVAEEVRNLAQRSARAANETTELIENTVERVSNGTSIANQTAKALGEIVTQVSKVNDLVGEIAVASKEQSEGIKEVGYGLSQIDKVTQANSGNAEETASAAEELSAQAARLKTEISKFKLADQENAYQEALQWEMPLDFDASQAHPFLSENESVEPGSNWENSDNQFSK